MEGLGGLLALKSLPWTCPLTGAQLGPPCATVGLTFGLRLGLSDLSGCAGINRQCSAGSDRRAARCQFRRPSIRGPQFVRAQAARLLPPGCFSAPRSQGNCLSRE